MGASESTSAPAVAPPNTQLAVQNAPRNNFSSNSMLNKRNNNKTANKRNNMYANTTSPYQSGGKKTRRAHRKHRKTLRKKHTCRKH